MVFYPFRKQESSSDSSSDSEDDSDSELIGPPLPTQYTAQGEDEGVRQSGPSGSTAHSDEDDDEEEGQDDEDDDVCQKNP